MLAQNKFLKQFKYSIRSYSIRKGKHGTWCFFKKIENLIKYHSFRRFINLLKYFYLKYRSKISALNLPKEINNGVFYLLVDNRDANKKKVIKIPRFNNTASNKLLKLIKNKKGFQNDYKDFLMNLTKDRFIGKHLPELHKVERDGTYVSSFINGLNLKEIKNQIINKNCKLNLVRFRNSLSELLENINNYRKTTNKIIGDWGSHNLIYDPDSNTIYNVDLEGLCIYGKSNIESSSEYITAELLSFQSLISIAEKDESLLEIFGMVEDKVLNLKPFIGATYFTGYQSIKIKQNFFNGRKNCEQFVKSLPVDFKGKTVLDIGSCWGSVLFELSSFIENGYGIDKDYDYLTVAEKIRESNGHLNINFYNFDLETIHLQEIIKIIKLNKLNFIFLLDILNELSDPEELLKDAANISDFVIIEIKGSDLLLKHQKRIIAKYFNNIEYVDLSNKNWWFSKNSEVMICYNGNKLYDN